MSNLIITVIAIGLAAALSLGGVYYGGQAFLDTQARARATNLIAVATEVASAWRQWAKVNNTQILNDIDWTQDGSDGNIADDLVPDYLPVFPKIPPGVSPNTNWYGWLLPATWSVWGYDPGNYGMVPFDYAYNTTTPNALIVQNVEQKVCEQVVKITRGASATVFEAEYNNNVDGNFIDIGDGTTDYSRRPVDCIKLVGGWSGSDNEAMCSGAGPCYIFLLKVF